MKKNKLNKIIRSCENLDVRKCRLLILSGNLQTTGGVETHLYEYCKFARDQHIDVTLVIGSITCNPDMKCLLESRGVKIIEFDFNSRRLGAINRLWCLIYFLLERYKYDFLYSHGISGYALWVGRILAPKVWAHHHHNMASAEVALEWPCGYINTLKTVDWIVCCTPNQAEFLNSSFSRSHQAICLPYLKCEPSLSAPRSQIAKPKSITLGFFGRIQEAKGVRTLLELGPWLIENGFECRLHGEDKEFLLPKILPEAISWCGGYNAENELDSLMNAVDIVVIPSSGNEGLPIVLSEAISRGVPVVAFDGGGLKHIADFDRGIIVTPQSISNFKQAILTMRDRLAEPNLGTSLAKNYKENLGNLKTHQWWINQFDHFDN